MNYRRNPDIAWRLVDGECILVDSQLGEVQVLNETASLIWEHLESSRDELKELIVSTYDVAPETADADITLFLQELAGTGLVVPA